MAADLPENYAAHPEAFQFIKDVPTDWEESITLQGEVGDFVVTARQERGGQDWYLGAVTDEHERKVDLDLDFLTPGLTYRAEMYLDGPGADWDTKMLNTARPSHHSEPPKHSLLLSSVSV